MCIVFVSSCQENVKFLKITSHLLFLITQVGSKYPLNNLALLCSVELRRYSGCVKFANILLWAEIMLISTKYMSIIK